MTRNSFVAVLPEADHDPQDFQIQKAHFPQRPMIQALQRRGAVFLACHNAIWELGQRLIAADAIRTNCLATCDVRGTQQPPDRRRRANAGCRRYRRRTCQGGFRICAMSKQFLFAPLLICDPGLVLCSAAAPPPGTPAARLEATEAQYPPWQNGENDDATQRGLVFTVPPVDDMADFHGSLDDPALILYVSGNYFFAMAGIVRAFGEAYPPYRGRNSTDAAARLAAEAIGRRRHHHLRQPDVHREAGRNDGGTASQRGLGNGQARPRR